MDSAVSVAVAVPTAAVSVFLLLTAAPILASAQSPLDSDRPTIRAARIAAPLQIDGVLNERLYADTPAIDEFIQAVPTEGAEPSERTEVWIAFDDSHVYVAGRVWDSEGEDGWVANEMRRDASQLRSNDSFHIYFDTYRDRRNALGFFVNPIGGFADVQFTNEGSPNFDWNPVWDLRTGRFDGGWTIEMAIPFTSLRYRPSVEQVWGVQIVRLIRRHNEWIYLTPMPIQVAGGGLNGVFRVSLYSDLVGIEAPPTGRNLDVKPSVTSRLVTDRVASPAIENDLDADVSLDAKYALTRNLALDLTLNTDFAQVEVDEQQVNLTRFSLFFPEKRDFFLEGRGVFDFGVAGGLGGVGSAPTLFYSRRIGIQGTQPVQVLGGGRLTGKLGAFDLGLLSIQTNADAAASAVETNFTVVRVRRDVLARGNVGVLFENRSRSLSAPEGSNQAWGVDASFGLNDETYLSGYYAGTATPGMSDDDHSYRGRLSYDADLFGGSAEYLVVEEDFNPEIGFVRRSGFRQSAAGVRYSPRPASIPWIRQMTFGADITYIENDEMRFIESRSRSGRFELDLESGDGFTLSGEDIYEYLPTTETISGAPFAAGRYAFQSLQAIYRFGPQRPWQGNLNVRWGDFYSGDRLSLGMGNGRLELTPQVSVEPSLEFNWLDLPQQTTSGEFNQHVARTRVTWTMTPRAYVSGLVQYNSGSDNFSGNLRFRWEWAPGSEFFVVYTEDRDTSTLDRWSELNTRGVVVKVTRLLRT